MGFVVQKSLKGIEGVSDLNVTQRHRGSKLTKSGSKAWRGVLSTGTEMISDLKAQRK